ncbi:Vesicle transport protein SFT2C, partial [Ophiophagus hannah]
AGFLRGPSRFLGDPDRRGLAILYLGSVGGTLYAALGLRSTLLTVLGAVVQLGAGGAYLFSSLPGGSAGLRYVSSFLGSFVRRSVSKALPVLFLEEATRATFQSNAQSRICSLNPMNP